MNIEYSNKIKQLPVYLFAEIDKMKEEYKSQGKEVISLGIGDPDLPTPGVIIDALKRSAEDPANHQYPSYDGLLEFRKKVAQWFKTRYNVDLDPQTEVLSLIGSKEGVGHLPFAFINRDDYVLVPSPGYPVYRSGTIFAEGKPYFMPLKKENNFYPDLKTIPDDVLSKAKLMFINYPNNPTSAIATKEFFTEVVSFAKKNNIIVAHDAAYNELYFDDQMPISFLEVEGAREVGIELHSFSKTFNMTGWRIGFAVGNKDIINGLGRIKSNLDSGIFQAVQYAAIAAIENYEELNQHNRTIFQKRRDYAIERLQKLGWKYLDPQATFYLWIETVPGYDSKTMAKKMLQDQGLVVTPGNGFGDAGEGYIRMALTVSEDVLKKVFDKIEQIEW